MKSVEEDMKIIVEKLEKVRKDQENMTVFDRIENQLPTKTAIMNKIKSLKQKFNTKFTEKYKLLFDKLDFFGEKFHNCQARLDELK